MPLTHSRWSFVLPGCWIVLVGAGWAAGLTPWGISGHPSNSVIILIFAVLSAPVFGIVGGAYALFGKNHLSRTAKTVAIIVNFSVVCAGAFFWLWWFG